MHVQDKVLNCFTRIFVGHYSKQMNVQFRKTLQATENSKKNTEKEKDENKPNLDKD